MASFTACAVVVESGRSSCWGGGGGGGGGGCGGGRRRAGSWWSSRHDVRMAERATVSHSSSHICPQRGRQLPPTRPDPALDGADVMFCNGCILAVAVTNFFTRHQPAGLGKLKSRASSLSTPKVSLCTTAWTENELNVCTVAPQRMTRYYSSAYRTMYAYKHMQFTGGCELVVDGGINQHDRCFCASSATCTATSCQTAIARGSDGGREEHRLHAVPKPPQEHQGDGAGACEDKRN